jgi:hypothetical protein
VQKLEEFIAISVAVGNPRSKLLMGQCLNAALVVEQAAVTNGIGRQRQMFGDRPEREAFFCCKNRQHSLARGHAVLGKLRTDRRKRQFILL